MSSRTPARPAPRWTRLEADERRSQILACAGQLFTDHAYDAVSMGEIAAAAGVRRGLLHHYFGTKRDLYVEVVRELLDRLAGAAARSEAPTAGADTLEELVDVHVRRWLRLVEEEAPTWFALIDAEGVADDPAVREVVEQTRSAIVDTIIEALGVGHERDDARVVLRAYSALADTTTREWLQRGTIDHARAHALLSASLVAMVREVVPAVERAGRTAPTG